MLTRITTAKSTWTLTKTPPRQLPKKSDIATCLSCQALIILAQRNLLRSSGGASRQGRRQDHQARTQGALTVEGGINDNDILGIPNKNLLRGEAQEVDRTQQVGQVQVQVQHVPTISTPLIMEELVFHYTLLLVLVCLYDLTSWFERVGIPSLFFESRERTTMPEQGASRVHSSDLQQTIWAHLSLLGCSRREATRIQITLF